MDYIAKIKLITAKNQVTATSTGYRGIMKAYLESWAFSASSTTLHDSERFKATDI
jgi:hypothetical protein